MNKWWVEGKCGMKFYFEFDSDIFDGVVQFFEFFEVIVEIFVFFEQIRVEGNLLEVEVVFVGDGDSGFREYWCRVVFMD